MNKADQLIERGAAGLRRLSEEMAARGGIAEKLAGELAEDAAFLRKLKPSLIKARVKGEAPTNQKPSSAPPPAPRAPQMGKRPKPPGSGLNPFVVVGAALVAGVVLAKLIDWRGHAHPRR